MKKAILGLAVTALLSSTAMACQEEAQFIGNVTTYSKTDCSYEINFTQFNASYVCPLNIGDASVIRLKDESCSLRNGDQVSGVLVKKDNGEIVID